MSKDKKNAITDEKILKTVSDQLTASLTDLKAQLGDKKFSKRIKKAAKLLVAGIGKKPIKKIITKPAKKAIAKAIKVKSVKKKTARPIIKKAK